MQLGNFAWLTCVTFHTSRFLTGEHQGFTGFVMRHTSCFDIFVRGAVGW